MLMMKPQLQKPPTTARSTPLPLKLGCSAILSSPSILHINLPPATHGHTKHYLSKRYNRIRASSEVHAGTTPTTTGLDQNNKTAVTIKAVVSVQETAANLLSTLSLTAPLDALTDFSGKTFLLELVSAHLDPSKLATYQLRDKLN